MASISYEEYLKRTGSTSVTADQSADVGILEFIDNPLGTVASTLASTGTYVAEGVGNFFEGGVDAVGYGVAGAVDAFGMEDLSNIITEQFAKNTVSDAFEGIQSSLDNTTFNWAQSDSLYASVAEGAGYIGGTLLTGAVLPGSGILQLGKIGVPITSVVSGTGSGMSSAYQSGATDMEALGYGLLSGITTGLVEGISGGIGGVGTGAIDDIVVGSLRNKITGTATGRIAEIATKAVFEGGEEAIETLLDPLWQSMTFNEKAEFLGNWDEVGEAALIGALTSALVQVPSGITGTEWEAKQAEIVEKAKSDALTTLRNKDSQVLDQTQNTSNQSYTQELNNDFKTFTDEQLEGIRNTAQVRVAENSTEQTNMIKAYNDTSIGDSSNFGGVYTTNIYDVARVGLANNPKLQTLVNNTVIEPLNKAKLENVQLKEQYADEFKQVTEDLGISRGSTDSALVQRYGEGDITISELKQETNNWENVIAMEDYLRGTYDIRLEEINAVREESGLPTVAKREDYFRHMAEESNIFKKLTSGGKTSTTSDFAQPSRKVASFEKQRLGAKSKQDAVAGYIEYLQMAAYDMTISKQIKPIREMSKLLKSSNTDNNAKMADFFDEYGNLLSKMPTKIDTAVKKLVGDKAFTAVNYLGGRVKSNLILGNIGSAVSQTLNIPNGLALIGETKHMYSGLTSALDKNSDASKAMNNSQFMRERTSDVESQFKNKLIDKPRKAAVWMLGALDEASTKMIWAGGYNQAIEQGMNESRAISYADNLARRAVAGRGVGERTIAQESKAVNLLAPFTTEVGNTAKLLYGKGGFIQEKQFGRYLIYTMSAFLLNKAVKAIGASGQTHDPLEAVLDALGEDLSPLQRGGRIIGELLSSMPAGQTLASLYPEYGIDGIDLTREQLFGEGDPTRFGTDSIFVIDDITEVLTRYIMPFGGAQVEKTAKALFAIADEDGAVRNDNGEIQYIVDKDIVNEVKGILFGRFKETDAYYDAGTTPVSENQEAEMRERVATEGITLKEAYNDLIEERTKDSLYSDYKEAIEDGKNASEMKAELEALEYNLGELYESKIKINNIESDKDSGRISGSKKEDVYDLVINSDLTDENKLVALKSAGYDKDLTNLQTAGITLDNWLVFQRDIAKLTADDDPNSDVEGQSLSGSYKEKVISVIESMDATTLEKNMLYASQDYALSSAQKDLIYNNVNSLDISNEAKLEIIKEFGGFTILENGNLKGW